MPNLTCPIPSNINPLQSNGFMFGIVKLPEVSYFCQEANVPGISLPSADFETPLSTAPIPGDKLSFGELSITFLIDEDMANYVAIYNWMVALGFPKSHEQYKAFVNSQSALASELSKGYSEGILQILNSSNNVVRTISFVDLFPTELQSLQLQSTTTETFYLAGNATFRYNYFEFT
jgi:hypothetical protein